MLPHKVCVVGAGYWGKTISTLSTNLNALGGIVDQDKDLLDYFSVQYLEDALQNTEFSGFTIATPMETHYNIAKSIITVWKYILVEKPLCLNVKDAENPPESVPMQPLSAE